MRTLLIRLAAVLAALTVAGTALTTTAYADWPGFPPTPMSVSSN